MGGPGGSWFYPTLRLPQLFITVMDKLRLEIRAMDEVGSATAAPGAPALVTPNSPHIPPPSPQIQPDLRELMETMNRMSHLPPDFEGRQKVNQW